MLRLLVLLGVLALCNAQHIPLCSVLNRSSGLYYTFNWIPPQVMKIPGGNVTVQPCNQSFTVTSDLFEDYSSSQSSWLLENGDAVLSIQQKNREGNGRLRLTCNAVEPFKHSSTGIEINLQTEAMCHPISANCHTKFISSKTTFGTKVGVDSFAMGNRSCLSDGLLVNFAPCPAFPVNLELSQSDEVVLRARWSSTLRLRSSKTSIPNYPFWNFSAEGTLRTTNGSFVNLTMYCDTSITDRYGITLLHFENRSSPYYISLGTSQLCGQSDREPSSITVAILVGLFVGILAVFVLLAIVSRCRPSPKNLTEGIETVLVNDDDRHSSSVNVKVGQTTVSVTGSKAFTEGGHGTLFRGKQGATDVALKVVPFDPSSPEQVLRESTALAMLPRPHNHPHVIEVIDSVIHQKSHSVYGTADESIQDRGAVLQSTSFRVTLSDLMQPNNALMIVTPFFPEGSLRDLVSALRRKNEVLDQNRLVRYMIQLCEAVIFLHSRGIIHRDIKEENLLLADGARRVVLTDFGIAAAVGSSSAVRHTTWGTELIKPPEFKCGQPGGHAVDLWLVGALLYNLASNEPSSYQTDLAWSTARERRADFFQRAQESVTQHYDRKLIDVMDGLLRHEPGDRWPLEKVVRKLDDLRTLNDKEVSFRTEKAAPTSPIPTAPAKPG